MYTLIFQIDFVIRQNNQINVSVLYHPWPWNNQERWYRMAYVIMTVADVIVLDSYGPSAAILLFKY